MLLYRSEPQARRILVLGKGELTRTDVRAFLDWQLLEGLWEFGVLYDLRAVTKGLAADEYTDIVNYIAFVARNLPPRGPIAIVGATGIAATAVAECSPLAQSYAMRVKSFDTEPEALGWLAAETSDPDLRFFPPSHGKH
jgi:hypothetical protein